MKKKTELNITCKLRKREIRNLIMYSEDLL